MDNPLFKILSVLALLFIAFAPTALYVIMFCRAHERRRKAGRPVTLHFVGAIILAHVIFFVSLVFVGVTSRLLGYDLI